MANILVTGANRGIGLELCRQYSQRGDEVYAACRAGSSALDDLGVRVFDSVDVASQSSTLGLAERLGDVRLDILINNAGILVRDSLQDFDTEGLESQFRINAIGPLLMTRSMLPKLADNAKVAIVTSRMGSIEDNTSGGYYGYRMSKAAVNIAGMSLARDLEGQGVAVALLHPGMVATDMTGQAGVPVSMAAGGLIERIDALDSATSGSFWHAEGYRLPW